MKNWGWVVLLILVVSVISWFKLGSVKPVMSCQYGDTEKKTETICVYKLKENSLIKNPLKISGRARGSWFFEASFPIELLDQNDQLLAGVVAQAQGDWMTNDLVPFTAELKFETPLGDVGKLVFKRDNPSGLPGNDASFAVSVRFR